MFYIKGESVKNPVQNNNPSINAPVNCNHGPPWSGGVPVIAGEVGRVLTFQVAPQCRGNAVVLFGKINSHVHVSKTV